MTLLLFCGECIFAGFGFYAVVVILRLWWDRGPCRWHRHDFGPLGEIEEHRGAPYYARRRMCHSCKTTEVLNYNLDGTSLNGFARGFRYRSRSSQ